MYWSRLSIPHRHCVYKKIVQDLYNWLYKMYTTFQKTFVYIHFVYKIKRTILTKFCTQNVYKSLLKCGIHFVYILYTRVCPNVVYILYKNILYTKCIQSFVEMWDTILCKNILYTFHIHQFWCTKSVHHKHYVYNFYTKLYAYINVCRMDPLFQHILTRLLCTF